MSAPSNETFGERLLKARRRAGYKKREDFAKAIGVNKRTVQRWEGDAHLPRDHREKIASIAKLLKVDLLWLETGIGAPDGQQLSLPEVEDYLSSHAVRDDVAAALRKLPFAELLMPHPTVSDLERLCLLLEMTMEPRRQRSDGDKSR